MPGSGALPEVRGLPPPAAVLLRGPCPACSPHVADVGCRYNRAEPLHQFEGLAGTWLVSALCRGEADGLREQWGLQAGSDPGAAGVGTNLWAAKGRKKPPKALMVAGSMQRPSRQGRRREW